MDLETIRHIYLRRIVATALRAAGIRATRALTTRLARRLFELNTPGRQRAESRLRDALGPHVDPSAVRTVAAAAYEHTARFWTEALFIPRLLRDSSWRRFVTVPDEAAWRHLAADRRGCILTTAYFGNPAAGIWTLGQIFRPVYVVVDFLAQPELRAWQRELYEHRWVRPIDRPHAAQVPDILRRGGTVAMIFEHERPRGRAVPVSFLGRTLRAYPTLGRLARWHDVPVGVFTCRRMDDPDFTFVLDLHETIDRAKMPPAAHAPTASSSGRNFGAGESPPIDEAIVRRIAVVLERAVMAHPQQYYWLIPTLPPSKPQA
jgi:lauroyl/myristoyl acyltransferase